MSQNPPPITLLPQPLPVAADDTIDADLDVSLSTPHTLVLSATLEITAESSETQTVDLALVIPRSKCHGERPLLSALLDAVSAAVARAMRSGTTPLRALPRRVVALAAGRPYLIPVLDAA
jgi:hypothetical protein